MSTFRRSLAAFGLMSILVWATPVAPAGAQTQTQPQARQQPAPTPAAKVDAFFSRWDSTATPGCAVGAAIKGEEVLAKGYGMADLEHDAVISADTIFEAGSVSKQFTAAAVLLLVREGRLSLDDPIRKHFPELPASVEPVTIRHMLQHTSGLRDWGEIAALSGWPRTTRAYTHAHVFDILTRQTALNFAPGTDWSYSNSGYNLAAMLVARVGGEPFADFTRKRLFEPLGMRRTSWRDDRTRVVKGRATAYDENRSTFQTLMPFENVHGNGGLLTTVGDLLRWNRYLFAGRIADAAFAAEQQDTGTLADGRDHGYGMGLFLGTCNKGLREVYHGGATAAYRAFLTHFPDHDVSVAVLCNAGSASAERYAHQVAEVYLGDALRPEPMPAAVEVPAATLDAVAGMYRHVKRGVPMVVEREGAGLKVMQRPTACRRLPNAVSPRHLGRRDRHGCRRTRRAHSPRARQRRRGHLRTRGARHSDSPATERPRGHLSQRRSGSHVSGGRRGWPPRHQPSP